MMFFQLISATNKQPEQPNHFIVNTVSPVPDTRSNPPSNNNNGSEKGGENISSVSNSCLETENNLNSSQNTNSSIEGLSIISEEIQEELDERKKISSSNEEFQKKLDEIETNPSNSNEEIEIQKKTKNNKETKNKKKNFFKKSLDTVRNHFFSFLEIVFV